MRKKITLETVIDVVKLSVFLSWCWPLPKDATKLKVTCATLYQYMTLLSNLSLTLALFNMVRNHFNDPVIIAKALMFMAAITHVVLSIAVYRINCHRLQFVIFEMKNFSQLAKPHEKDIFQQYIHKCLIFYGGSMIGIYLFDIYVIVGPATMDQPFPIDAEYPFDIYYQPMKTIIYIHQSLCALYVAPYVCMNVLISLLLWFITARFELLTEKLRAVTNISSLIKCIKEHQKLLKYAEQVVCASRPFALIAVTISTFGLIAVGLVLYTDQSLSMKIQCIGIGFGGLTEVFMYSWPAEHLIRISSEIGEAIYNAEWYGQSVELQQNLQIVVMRAQKPVIVAVPCLMPSLSLSYYATYLSTIFSYFTTLRVFMQTNQNVN